VCDGQASIAVAGQQAKKDVEEKEKEKAAAAAASQQPATESPQPQTVSGTCACVMSWVCHRLSVVHVYV